MSGGHSGDPDSPPGGSGGPTRGPRRVGSLSLRTGKGREAIPEVWEIIPEVQVGSGGHSGDPMALLEVRKVIPEVQKSLTEVQDGSGVPSRGSGQVWSPYQRSGKGVEAFPEIRYGSAGLPVGPRSVGKPSRRFVPPGGSGGPHGGPRWLVRPFLRYGTGQEAILDVQGMSGDSSSGPGRVGRPSQR